MGSDDFGASSTGPPDAQNSGPETHNAAQWGGVGSFGGGGESPPPQNAERHHRHLWCVLPAAQKARRALLVGIPLLGAFGALSSLASPAAPHAFALIWDAYRVNPFIIGIAGTSFVFLLFLLHAQSGGQSRAPRSEWQLLSLLILFSTVVFCIAIGSLTDFWLPWRDVVRVDVAALLVAGMLWLVQHTEVMAHRSSKAPWYSVVPSVTLIAALLFGAGVAAATATSAESSLSLRPPSRTPSVAVNGNPSSGSGSNHPEHKSSDNNSSSTTTTTTTPSSPPNTANAAPSAPSQPNLPLLVTAENGAGKCAQELPGTDTPQLVAAVMAIASYATSTSQWGCLSKAQLDVVSDGLSEYLQTSTTQMFLLSSQYGAGEPGDVYAQAMRENARGTKLTVAGLGGQPLDRMGCDGGIMDYEPLVEANGEITALYGRPRIAEYLASSGDTVFVKPYEVPRSLVAALYQLMSTTHEVWAPVGSATTLKGITSQAFIQPGDSSAGQKVLSASNTTPALPAFSATWLYDFCHMPSLAFTSSSSTSSTLVVSTPPQFSEMNPSEVAAFESKRPLVNR